MTSEVVTAAGRFEVSPHACFACGELNAHGLHLVLHVAGDTCWTELTLRPDFQGWEGIAHGGIVATILDEVMGWALAGADAWGYTARMSIEYKRPVPVGARIRGEGRLVERRRRLLTLTGRLLDADTGEVWRPPRRLYVAAPAARREELKARYGFRLVPEDAAPGRRPVTRGDAQARGGRGADRAPERGHGGRPRVRGRAPAGGARPRPGPRRPPRRPARVRRGRARRASPRSPTRPISRASGWSRRGSAPRSGSGRRSSTRSRPALRREVRGVGPARLLVVAEALAGDEIRELRWLAIHVLGWIVAADPERAWQVIRRIGRDADDWITVDTLAGVTAVGHPGGAVPLGGAGAARLQPQPLGAPARRLHRSPPSRTRATRPGVPRP